MHTTLVFDIETIPDVEGLRTLYSSDDHTLSILSDHAVVERAQALQLEKKGSDFLPLHLQRIIAISCVFRTMQKKPGFFVKSLETVNTDEQHLIHSFYQIIDKYTPQLVSWNGGGFDLPVLHYRSMMHGISAPHYWDFGKLDRDFKWNNYLNRYHLRHIDLMDLLALYQPRAYIPLDELAKLCGFPGKLGMDGSQVWQAYQNQQGEQIREYCETDVVNTYLLYCRFQKMRGLLTEAAYLEEMQLVRRVLSEKQQMHWQHYLAAWKSGDKAA